MEEVGDIDKFECIIDKDVKKYVIKLNCINNNNVNATVYTRKLDFKSKKRNIHPNSLKNLKQNKIKESPNELFKKNENSNINNIEKENVNNYSNSKYSDMVEDSDYESLNLNVPFIDKKYLSSSLFNFSNENKVNDEIQLNKEKQKQEIIEKIFVGQNKICTNNININTPFCIGYDFNNFIDKSGKEYFEEADEEVNEEKLQYIDFSLTPFINYNYIRKYNNFILNELEKKNRKRLIKKIYNFYVPDEYNICK